MNYSALKTKIMVSHAATPQRQTLASMALASIEAGIQELAKLGHTVTLVEGPDGAPQEYPKMVYRGGGGVADQLIVHNQEEEKKYLTEEEGYRLTPLVRPAEEPGREPVPEPLPVQPPVQVNAGQFKPVQPVPINTQTTAPGPVSGTAVPGNALSTVGGTNLKEQI